MKKFPFFITILFTCGAFSAPVGDPASPNLIQQGLFLKRDSAIDFRVGYEGDFVTDGKMQQHQNGNGRVDSYKQNTNSGTFTLNLVDRMDLYGVLGGSNAKTHWRFESGESESIHRFKVEAQDSLLWAVGARAILYEWWHVILGLGGRYSSAQYQPLEATLDDIDLSVAGTHFLWREWQVNVDMSYRIDLFTTYIGMKYSNALARIGNFSLPISSDGLGSNELTNRIPVGLFLGCSICSGDYLMLNVEGRLIDEEAVTVSAEFRF